MKRHVGLWCLCIGSVMVFSMAGCGAGEGGLIRSSRQVGSPTGTAQTLFVFQAAQRAGWALIGCPYVLTQPFSSFGLTTYHWNPVSNQYDVSPNPPADTFHLGQGYWAYLVQSVPISGPGTLAGGLDTTKPIAIAIHTGWNMVSNPFAAAIPMANLSVGSQGATSAGTPLQTVANTGSVSSLYSFDTDGNRYITLGAASVVPPWTGYWIYSTREATLIFAPAANTTTGTVTGTTGFSSVTTGGVTTGSVTTGGITTSGVTTGTLSSSTTGSTSAVSGTGATSTSGSSTTTGSAATSGSAVTSGSTATSGSAVTSGSATGSNSTSGVTSASTSGTTGQGTSSATSTGTTAGGSVSTSTSSTGSSSAGTTGTMTGGTTAGNTGSSSTTTATYTTGYTYSTTGYSYDAGPST